MKYKELFNKINDGSVTINLNGHKFHSNGHERLMIDLKDKIRINDDKMSESITTIGENKYIRSEHKIVHDIFNEIQKENHLRLNYIYDCKLCGKNIKWKLSMDETTLTAVEFYCDDRMNGSYVLSECSKKDKYKRKNKL